MYRQKTGSFKFYPSEREIQLTPINKDGHWGRYPKEPKLTASRNRDCEWQLSGHHHTANQGNLKYLLYTYQREGMEGRKTDKQAQATRSNANVMGRPQPKTAKAVKPNGLRSHRAPPKITNERLLASIISSH